MRITTTLMIAAAGLVAAAPAIAQNADTNGTADMTATNTDTNTAVPVDNTAAPVAPTTTETTTTATDVNATGVPVDQTAPAPEHKSFPWGIIGLLGLLGFIPRTRRRG